MDDGRAKTVFAWTTAALAGLVIGPFLFLPMLTVEPVRVGFVPYEPGDRIEALAPPPRVKILRAKKLPRARAVETIELLPVSDSYPTNPDETAEQRVAAARYAMLHSARVQPAVRADAASGP